VLNAQAAVTRSWRCSGRLEAAGRTIVLVEQNTQGAVDIADDVYLMQGGRVVLAQPAADVDLARLHQLYFARPS